MMKKLLGILWTALLLLSVRAAACADALLPDPQPVQESSPNVLPWVLIGVAVIAAAVIIWRIRKKR